MRHIFLVFFLVIIHASPVFACTVCFGDPNSPLTQGIGLGIWVLMGFIGAVLILFSILFWNIYRRMKKFSTSH